VSFRVITLPDERLPDPDLRSPVRYLWWLARLQRRTLVLAIALGVLWMLANAAIPAILGRTVDAGIVRRDGTALATGAAVLVLAGAVQAVTGVFRHRLSVQNWMQAALRTQQLVGHHVAAEGPAVAATTTTGEAIATAGGDAPRLGEIFDIMGRFWGSVVAYAAIAVLLLRIDVGLALFVLLGAPALSASLLLVVRPLDRLQGERREAEGRLTALGADTVAGLRVLRGIGGEDQFLARYVGRSQEVRRVGQRVAGPQAALEAAHVLLPGAFVVVLTWLGARAAVAGRITPGDLVTLYGYAAFLTAPLATATETLGKWVRARVAAEHVVTVLRKRDTTRDGHPEPEVMPPPGSEITDPESGLRLRTGALTALVADVPGAAARIADRLAGLVPGGTPPRIGGVPVDRLDPDDVRARVLVSEAEPRLFSGSLRGGIDPGGDRDDASVLAAIETADAAEVLTALPGGLDGRVEERGRSFSGGQRQRLALARAVLAEPEVLVLVEPTSSVDAHTEARIAGRLRAARAGRTTLVTTTSPLLLDRADHVAFLAGGRVVAEGTHRELVRRHAGYRAVVTRAVTEDDPTGQETP
jgi:ABC-type multidrug transport system fused ATPase/permease subunit